MSTIYEGEQLTNYPRGIRLGEYKIKKGELLMSKKWVIKKGDLLLGDFDSPEECIKKLVELDGENEK